MKTKRSFLLSAILHAGIITGAIALMSIQKEKEEEIVLELSLAEPAPSQPQNVEKQIVKPLLKETVQPTSQLPMLEQAKIIEEIKPQAETKEVFKESKPIETPQLAQMEPKTTPPLSSPQPITPPVNAEEQYLDDHLSAIRDILIKYRKYPNQALRLKQEGDVHVSFRLKSNGEVEDIKISGSSGYQILDDDAKALIEKTALYFPRPPKSVRITVPLRYSLKVAA